MSGGQITIKKDFGNHDINNDKDTNKKISFNILEEMRNLNTQLSLNFITTYIYQLIHEHLLGTEDCDEDEFDQKFKTIKNLLSSALSNINEKYEGITLELDTIFSVKSLIQNLSIAINDASNDLARSAANYSQEQNNFPQHLAYQMSNINFVIKKIEQSFILKQEGKIFSLKNFIDYDKKIIAQYNNSLSQNQIATLIQTLKDNLLNNAVFQRADLELNKLHDKIKDVLKENPHLLSSKEISALHEFFNNLHKSSLIVILEKTDFSKIFAQNIYLINSFREQIDAICVYCEQLRQNTNFQKQIDTILILNIIHAYMQKYNIDNTDYLKLEDVKAFYLWQQKNLPSKNDKIKELISLLDSDVSFLALAIFMHGLNNTLDDYHDNMSLFKLSILESMCTILGIADNEEHKEKFFAMIRLIPSIVNFEFYTNFKESEKHSSITQDDLLCLLRLTQVPTHKNRCEFLKENHFKFYAINQELFKIESVSTNNNISLSKLPILYADVLKQYANINNQIVPNCDPYEIINNILMLWKNFDNVYLLEQEIYTSILKPLFMRNLPREDFNYEIKKMLLQNDDIFPSATSTSISTDTKKEIYNYASRIYLTSFDLAEIQKKQKGTCSYVPFFGVFEINIPPENIIQKLAEYHKTLMHDDTTNQVIFDKYTNALNTLESKNNIQILNPKLAAYNICLDAYKILEKQYKNITTSNKLNKNIINSYNNYKLALANLFEQFHTKNDINGEMSHNPAIYDYCLKTFMQTRIQYNNKENLRQASIKLHLLRIWEKQLRKLNYKNAASAPIYFYRQRTIKPDTLSTQPNQSKQTLISFKLDKNKSMNVNSTIAISDETKVVCNNEKDKPMKMHNT